MFVYISLLFGSAITALYTQAVKKTMLVYVFLKGQLSKFYKITVFKTLQECENHILQGFEITMF